MEAETNRGVARLDIILIHTTFDKSNMHPFLYLILRTWRYLRVPVLIFTCSLMSLLTNAKKIETEILIHASPDRVWEILTDFSRYPNWNPFIKSLMGDVKVGHKIKVDANGQKFKPRVLTFDKNQKFSWKGKLLLGGLFDGQHTFELIDNGDGTTTFRQFENFKGLLVPFFARRLNTETRAGFADMNKKLKELAEGI